MHCGKESRVLKACALSGGGGRFVVLVGERCSDEADHGSALEWSIADHGEDRVGLAGL